MRLSGPIIIFGAVVVVVVAMLCWSCATVVWAAEVVSPKVVAVVVPLCVFAAGAVFVVELPLFFFAFAVDVVCAAAIDAVTRNALIQKLTVNFKYLLIDVLSRTRLLLTSPVQYSHPIAPSRYNFRGTAHPSCGPPPAVIQTKYSSLLRQI